MVNRGKNPYRFMYLMKLGWWVLAYDISIWEMKTGRSRPGRCLQLVWSQPGLHETLPLQTKPNKGRPIKTLFSVTEILSLLLGAWPYLAGWRGVGACVFGSLDPNAFLGRPKLLKCTLKECLLKILHSRSGILDTAFLISSPNESVTPGVIEWLIKTSLLFWKLAWFW